MDRPSLVEHVQALHLNRLRQPHSSTYFIPWNLPLYQLIFFKIWKKHFNRTRPSLLNTYPLKTTNVSWSRHPRFEVKVQEILTAENQWNCLWSVYCFGQQISANIFFKPKSDNPLLAYSQYIGYERRAKHPDSFVTRGIYERAIAEAAKRRFNNEPGAEEALRIFWSGYSDALVKHSSTLISHCIDVGLANTGCRRGCGVGNVQKSSEKRARLRRSLGQVYTAPREWLG